ncbi:MAG: hypothetical protein ACRC16_26230, partial [Aeromonas salmonicida]
KGQGAQAPCFFASFLYRRCVPARAMSAVLPFVLTSIASLLSERVASLRNPLFFSGSIAMFHYFSCSIRSWPELPKAGMIHLYLK